MPLLSINLRDTSNPAIQQMVAALRGKGAITASSGAVRVEIREHFAMLERSRPNKNSWPRQHFWAAVRNTVNNPVVTDPMTATVSTTHVAIKQRLEGGYIFPTAGKKFLTIPARPEAYGKRAREFNNLHFGFAENKFGNLAPALISNTAQEVGYGRKRKDGTRKVTPGAVVGGDALFWLVRKVFQPADRSVFPSDGKLFLAAERGATEYVTALADRANKGGAK